MNETQLGQGLFVLMLPLRPLDRSGNSPPTGVLGEVGDHSRGHPPGRGEVGWVPQTFLHPHSLSMSLEGGRVLGAQGGVNFEAREV